MEEMNNIRDSVASIAGYSSHYDMCYAAKDGIARACRKIYIQLNLLEGRYRDTTSLNRNLLKMNYRGKWYCG